MIGIIASQQNASVAVAPSVPSNLTVTPVSDSSLQLSWSGTAPSGTEYQIWRKADSCTDFSYTNLGLVSEQSFLDTGLDDNRLYCYQVRALYNSVYTAYSSRVSGTTLETPVDVFDPPVLSGVLNGNQTDLSWTDGSNTIDFDSTEIEYSLDGVNFDVLDSYAAGIFTGVDQGVIQPGLTVTYRARFYDSVEGYTGWSNEVTIEYPVAAPLLAFEGATGFARYARGAYALYEETGLEADLPTVELVSTGAELRTALQLSTPRIIIPTQGGNYFIGNGTNPECPINDPYLTIAGLPVPGGGICITGLPVFYAKEVIARNVRFRLAEEFQGVNAIVDDSMNIRGSSTQYAETLENLIFDKCSYSWGADEIIGIGGTTNLIQKVTIQNSFIYEPTRVESGNKVGKALLIGNGQTNQVGEEQISIHNVLFAHSASRNPRFGGAARTCPATIINVISYNWNSASSNYGPLVEADIIHCKNKMGTNTQSNSRAIEPFGGSGLADPVLHVEDVNNPNGMNTVSAVLGTYTVAGARQFQSEYGFTPVADSGATLEAHVLSTAGAFPRDAADTRIVNDYNNGTGAFISSSSEVGGFPTLAAGTYLAHNNGVHLDWLVSKGYAADNTAASALTALFLKTPGNGNTAYSILEEFINDVDYHTVYEGVITDVTYVSNYGSGQNFGYSQYIPGNYNPSVAMPLVIWLHGLGDRSTDNGNPQFWKLKGYGPLMEIINNDKEYNFLMIAPQQPGDVDGQYTNRTSWDTAVINESLSDFKSKGYNVDLNRVYITGQSMGGGGCVAYLRDYGDTVAASFIICPTTTGADMCNSYIKETPQWYVHNRQDNVVNISSTVNYINNMNACSPAPIIAPKATIFEGGVQHNGWQAVYGETSPGTLSSDGSIGIPAGYNEQYPEAGTGLNWWEWLLQYEL